MLKLFDSCTSYKFVAMYILYGVCVQTYVLISVIQRDLVL